MYLCAISHGRVGGWAGSPDTVRAHTPQAGHSPDRSHPRQRSVASQTICCPSVAQETRQFAPVASLEPPRMPIWPCPIAKTVIEPRALGFTRVGIGLAPLIFRIDYAQRWRPRKRADSSPEEEQMKLSERIDGRIRRQGWFRLGGVLILAMALASV